MRSLTDYQEYKTTGQFPARCWNIANLRGYESCFLQNEKGLFDSDLHDAKSNLLRSWFESEDMKKAWRGPAGRDTYHPDFVTYVDQLTAQ